MPAESTRRNIKKDRTKRRIELALPTDANLGHNRDQGTAFDSVNLRHSRKNVPQYSHPSDLITLYYVDSIADRFQRCPNDPLVVCDVGGGNGAMLKGIIQELRDRGFTRVSGVLVELLRRNASAAVATFTSRGAMRTFGIRTVVGDAVVLDSLLGRGSVQAIVGRNFLHYNSDAEQGAIIAAVRRTLARNGFVSFLQPSYKGQAVEFVHKACMAAVTEPGGPNFAERLLHNCVSERLNAATTERLKTGHFR